MMLHCLIPPEIHDLYNKDIDIRKLERQLCVLPDLLNSSPSLADIASKVTRVRTLASVLAALFKLLAAAPLPLASSMFSD